MRVAALAASFAVALAACDSADKHAAASGAASKSRRHAAGAAKAGTEDLAEMVAAFTTSRGPPVELKFTLAHRPEVGQPLDVNVAVVPHAPVPDSLSVTFTVAEGLEIVDGSDLPRMEKLVDGAPIRHVVTILPKRDGIFALTAVVSFSAGNRDTNRTFAIPVIAGEGLPAQVAQGL